MDRSILKVLGVDPGYDRLGFALLGVDKVKNEVNLYKLGVISSNRQQETTERIYKIGEDFAKLLKLLNPDVVALERIPAMIGRRILMDISEVCGVLKFVARQKDVEIVEFTPAQVKKFITGRGNASKPYVRKMLQGTYGLQLSGVLDDTVDAIAVGITAGYLWA